MRRFIIILLAIIAAVLPLQAQEYSLSSVRIETDFLIRDSVDNIGNLYIHYPGQHPTVWTFVNNDGSVTVCTQDSGEQTTWIYELSANLEVRNKLSVKNELSGFGAFTKDNEGNYYIFYGERAQNQNHENMAVAKYNPQG